MTITQAVVVPAGLCCVRQQLNLDKQQVAAQLGVTPRTLGRWEQGLDNPPTHQLISYAARLDRRIMVGRDRKGMYDLAVLLPHLAAFRRARRLTQQQVADRMHLTVAAVGKFERAARDGKPVRWDSVVHYFAALGYQIGIARAQVLAVAS